MITLRIAIVLLAPLLMLAQTKPAEDAQKADAPKAPPIPLAIESEYYRADASLARAQTAADRAKTATEAAGVDLRAAIEALQKACGDKFMPYMSEKHIICVPKPPDKAADKPN